ncbi:MAG: hypothetical protein Q9190_006821 [Brigantiaea leucoxantha]
MAILTSLLFLVSLSLLSLSISSPVDLVPFCGISVSKGEIPLISLPVSLLISETKTFIIYYNSLKDSEIGPTALLFFNDSVLSTLCGDCASCLLSQEIVDETFEYFEAVTDDAVLQRYLATSPVSYHPSISGGTFALEIDKWSIMKITLAADEIFAACDVLETLDSDNPASRLNISDRKEPCLMFGDSSMRSARAFSSLEKPQVAFAQTSTDLARLSRPNLQEKIAREISSVSHHATASYWATAAGEALIESGDVSSLVSNSLAQPISLTFSIYPPTGISTVTLTWSPYSPTLPRPSSNTHHNTSLLYQPSFSVPSFSDPDIAALPTDAFTPTSVHHAAESRPRALPGPTTPSPRAFVATSGAVGEREVRGMELRSRVMMGWIAAMMWEFWALGWGKTRGSGDRMRDCLSVLHRPGYRL